jgi:thioesterase domain-containing protein
MDTIKTLEHTLHREVPLTEQMGLRVEAHDENELVLHADFEPNINIHGTAFGGSLYSICAVTCWGMLHLKFEEEGIDAHCVLGQAKIVYLLPVKGDIKARCRLPSDGSMDDFIQKLKNGEKAKIELSAEIFTDDGVAVVYDGKYATYFKPE